MYNYITEPLISVIIPCRITEDRAYKSRLALTLCGFGLQDIEPDSFEIIIVDDGSTIPIESLYREGQLGPHLPNLRIVRQIETGMSAAYNAGIQASHAPLIFLGIDDNVPCPILLRRHLTLHSNTDGAVVIGRELHFDLGLGFTDLENGTPDERALDQLPSLRNLVTELSMRGFSIKPQNFDFETIRRLSVLRQDYASIEEIYISGSVYEVSTGWLSMRLGNHSFPRTKLLEIGGMDTAFDPAGWFADIDLGLRVHSAKMPWLFDETAVSIHLTHWTEKSLTVNEGRAIIALITKHKEPRLALLLKAFNDPIDIRVFSDLWDAVC
jgi:glycosyltransferase involved in cell wall biosynthesis